MATTITQEASTPPLRDYAADTLTKLFRVPIDKFDLSDAMLFRDGEQWKPISHREVAERVEKVAAGLAALGIGKGDRVAILSENRPEWAIADFAALSLGTADVPLYATLPPNQIAYILGDAGAKAIFVSTRDQLDKILEIRDQVPSLGSIITFDPIQGDGIVTLDHLMDQGQKHIDSGDFPDYDTRTADIAPGDLATLIYTSGTTGDPKGVMLTHENLASNVAASDQHQVFRLEPGIIALSFLPLSHAFERMVDYLYWFNGSTIAYVDSMDRIAESMVEVRPHVMAAAPRVFEKIYTRVMGASGIKGKLVMWAKNIGEAKIDQRIDSAQPDPDGLLDRLADKLVFSKIRERTGGRVRGFVSGSAPLSPDIAKFFWAAGLRVYEGYGLTETSPVISCNRPAGVRLGTVGQLIPGTDVRIEESGEIVVRGPQVMAGYYNKPDATAETMTEDGWLRTGDIGELDDDGYLRITDRLKNIIVTAGGKNLAPAPIENAAAMSPYVSQVVMIGDRRPFASLLVIPDAENLREWARQQGLGAMGLEELAREPKVQEFLHDETIGKLTGFARYEMPKKIAILPRELTIEDDELTATMKVKRRVVEDRYSDLIEGIYRD